MSSNKEPQNCWEFMDCPDNIKKDCVVYLHDFGRDCWLLVDLKKGCPGSNDYKNCFECPWYKKHNPNS